MYCDLLKFSSYFFGVTAKFYLSSFDRRYVLVAFAASSVIVVFDIGPVYAGSENIVNGK